MGDLLNALLDISKLDAGVVEPNVAPVAIAPLFAKLEKEFVLQAGAKGIELRVVPVERSISTDLALLERILRNLLTNAVRHTTRGRVLLGARRRGPRLRIEIWDTGIGMEADQLGRIFQEFYQVGNPERDRTQGLGLGLAIVERLSQLLGHRVEVRSVPGKGSMFSVEVPVVDAELPAADRIASPGLDKLDFSSKLILLIEDDAQVLKGTTQLLQEWGCGVIGAETIGSALTKIGDLGQAPDLILADFRLRGEETGLMAIELVQQFVGGSMPAVIITGDTDPTRIREAANSGYTLLHKPVEVAALRTILEAELDCTKAASA
jgi:CheY-like chemotaxis protein/anti-sigma regulatory factor (Ser/Thr protein kinase)